MKKLIVLAFLLCVATTVQAASFCWFAWQKNCCPCFGLLDLSKPQNEWQVCKEFLPSFRGPRLEILSEFINGRAVTDDWTQNPDAPECVYVGFNWRGQPVVREFFDLEPQEYEACVETQRTWLAENGMQCVLHQ